MSTTALRILAALDALPSAGGRQVVCVDGPSGSGKSTLAAAIAKARPGAGVVHVDHLLAGWDGLPDVADAVLAQVVLPFRAGRVAQHRRYDWHTERFSTPIQVEAGSLLVVEGVGAGARLLAPWTDLLVWADADPEKRRRRALSRDPDVTGWWESWQAEEARHHTENATEERAGLLVLT